MIPTIPTSLATWLASARAAVIVDAFTLIGVTGTVARWIDADFDFTIPTPDDRAFVRGPLFTRGNINQRVGLSVDSMQLSITPTYRGQPVTFGAQTLLQAAQRGTLRGATLQLERLVFATGLEDYQGRWVEFAGTLSVRNTAGGKIEAQVLSELNLLDKPMPPDLYQAQCKNTVFDAQCGLNRSNFTVPGIATAATTGQRSSITSNLAIYPDHYFDQGVAQFATGANAGEKRTVKANIAGVLTFALPWPQDIAPGDAFVVVPGCSRNLFTCRTKFDNAIRFRGEPFIPQPETVN